MPTIARALFRLGNTVFWSVNRLRERIKSTLPPLHELISLKNKSALITGSGTGIGEAISYRFAEAGANLELVDINEENLLQVKENLQRFNVEINIHKVDLAKKRKH